MLFCLLFDKLFFVLFVTQIKKQKNRGYLGSRKSNISNLYGNNEFLTSRKMIVEKILRIYPTTI